MFRIIFICTVFIGIALNAKTYTLFLASANSIDKALNHYQNIINITTSNEAVIKIYENKTYSAIIRKIPTRDEALKIQKLFLDKDLYKDSYIKAYKTEPNYKTLEFKENTSKQELKKTKKVEFKQQVENSNVYITAITYFNTKQYEKSYEKFKKLFFKHNYNKNINYFLAKSAYHTKKYDEAIVAYERVLNLDPNFNQARYDYARILYKLKQKDEAKKEFNILLNTNIKEDTKTQIKEFLKVLDNQGKKKTISANLAIGFARSSNVNNGLNSPEYSLPGLNDIVVEAEAPIADSSVYEMANLNFFKYFKEQPIRMKNSFLIYNKNYFEEEDEDLTAISYKPSMSYYNNELKQMYTLGLTFDKIFRNTDEDFISFAITPKISTKNLSAQLKYQKIIYDHAQYEEKDFERIELYTKVNLFKYANYYAKASKNKKVQDLRTDIDKYTITNGLNLFYDITKKDKINLNYQFDYSKYEDENIGFDTRRRDRKHSVELSLKHQLTKNDVISVSTAYIKNYSNQDAYIYDEKELRLNYLKSFIW